MTTATAFPSSGDHPTTSSNTAAAAAPFAGGVDPLAATTGDKNFAPLTRAFLQYLKLEKHFSDYTVKSYGADLIQFGQFLTGQIGQLPGASLGRPATGEEVDQRELKCEPNAIREFLAYLYGQNYTKSTTARKLATLRSFYKYLIRRGH